MSIWYLSIVLQVTVVTRLFRSITATANTPYHLLVKEPEYKLNKLISCKQADIPGLVSVERMMNTSSSGAGDPPKPTGYEPKSACDISVERPMLSDAGISGGIDSNVSGGAGSSNSEQMAISGNRPMLSSSTVATVRSMAGGDSVAVKRRLVDQFTLSPTKDELYR